jgi:hypothetical protein
MRVLVLSRLVAFFLLVPTAAGKSPAPPTETAVVSTGRAPCGLAAHRGELWVLAELGGSIWVTSFEGSDVRRYDP